MSEPLPNPPEPSPPPGNPDSTLYHPGKAVPQEPVFESRSRIANHLATAGYEVLGQLGKGGMGVVYKARQTRLNRLVAIKLIRFDTMAEEGDLQRFRREADATARLRHPNIVQIYDAGQLDGIPFLCLELVEGSTLADEVKHGPWEPQRAARLVETLARAVQVAHESRIIHRDLKPANVLLTVTGEPKVADFGLAKLLDGGSGSCQTASGAILGTPEYMAPEQAQGRGHAVGPAADIWALGAILYQLLTGRPPFRAGTAFETILKVISQEPEPPHRLQPTTPLALSEICLKCLEKSPTNRYATAAELADDLTAFLAGKERPRRARRTRQAGWGYLRVAGVTLALLGVVGAGWWAYAGRTTPPVEPAGKGEDLQEPLGATPPVEPPGKSKDLHAPIRDYQARLGRDASQASEALKALLQEANGADATAKANIYQAIDLWTVTNLLLLAGRDRPESVEALLKELAPLPLPESKFERQLASARVALRRGHFEACLNGLTAAEAENPQRQELAATLADLATQAAPAAGDSLLRPDEVENLLKRLTATKTWQADLSNPKRSVGRDYAALVNELVLKRYLALDAPESFAALLPYARTAVETGHADAMTRLAFAECLLLQRPDAELAKATATEREQVEKVLQQLTGERLEKSARPYFGFVKGLMHRVKGEGPEAAQSFQDALAGDSRRRQQVAATAFTEAGDRATLPAKQFDLYILARERYGKDMPGTLWPRLTASAGKANREEFEPLLKEALGQMPLADWAVPEQVALADAFLIWAPTHKQGAIDLLDVIQPALMKAGAGRPEDAKLCLWLGKYHERRYLRSDKKDAKEKEQAVKRLAEAMAYRAKEMAQAKAVGGWRSLMELFNEEVVPLFRGMDETPFRYAVLVRMLPPEREKQTEPYHADLLLARLRLIRDHIELRRLDGKEERPRFLGDERRLTDKLLSTNPDKAAVLADTMDVCVALSDEKSLSQPDRDSFWKAGIDRLERLGMLLLEDTTYEHFAKGPELARTCAKYFRNKAKTATQTDKARLEQQAEQLEKKAEAWERKNRDK